VGEGWDFVRCSIDIIPLGDETDSSSCESDTSEDRSESVDGNDSDLAYLPPIESSEHLSHIWYVSVYSVLCIMKARSVFFIIVIELVSICTALGVNPGLCGENPVTYSLCFVIWTETVFSESYSFWVIPDKY
jgi:hypothetical protein